MSSIRNHVVTCTAAVLCGAVGLAVAGDRPGEHMDQKTSEKSGQKMGHDKEYSAKALTDQSFATKAAQAGMAEVELSQLALKKTQDDEVRSFAQQMIDDHKKANMQLKTIAQEQGLQIPQELDPKHRQELQKLQDKSGAEFDKAYMTAMEKDHDKVVDLFTRASNAEGLSPELQSFASTTLNTLQSHERLADTVKTRETREARADDDAETTQR